ncbi:MAG: arginase family protein [Anaerolineae bacterium]|nr:arginase family protein [Gloeobacterales cyanobacterium ES-bin-313]
MHGVNDAPRVAVLPVAHSPEMTVGIQAVLDASRCLDSFDPELGFEPFAVGVAVLPSLWDEAPFGNTERAVGNLLAQECLPIVLGGEQITSLGAIRAAWKRFPELVVVQITASTHLRESPGDAYGRHALAARIHDFSLPIVQIGVRNANRSEMERLAGFSGREHQVFWAQDFLGHGSPSAQTWRCDEVIAALPQSAIYLSVDFSALESGIMPSNGEPGGLGWYPLLELLRGSMGRVVACDLCEFVPLPGVNRPERTAARLLQKLVGYKFSN